eukprot:246346_1
MSVVYANYLTDEHRKLLVCGYLRLNFASYKPPSEIINLCIIWHATKQWLSAFLNNKCIAGIIGLPNVGKTSLFNVLSGMDLPAEDYPFCTINSAYADIVIPDKRFDDLCNTFDPKSRVVSTFGLHDIAAIVKNAYQGCGLGNQFLHSIQTSNILFHVVRTFEAKNIQHVEDSIDPIRDIKIMKNELRQKDIQILTKKQRKWREKDELECIKLLLSILEQDKDIEYAKQYSEKWVKYIQSYRLFTCKPMIFMINVSEKEWLKGYNTYVYMKQIKEYVSQTYDDAIVVPFCAAFEKRISAMSDKEMKEYLIKNETKSAKKEIIDAVFTSMHLINFFTCSQDEVRSWIVRNGTKALTAAGLYMKKWKFGSGFISAETYSYQDFERFGKNEDGVKNAGKYYANSKDYIVKDGDILSFNTRATERSTIGVFDFESINITMK